VTNYEVFLRDMRTDRRRSVEVKAYNFHTALDEVDMHFDSGNEEIIAIKKDFDEQTQDAAQLRISGSKPDGTN
jgi:hypothetical protein